MSSASFQTLPNPGPPQSGMIYPTTTTTTPTTTNVNDQNSSDRLSSGSFGMVFVVLAIILAISGIACVIGRLCGKKSNKSHKQNHPKAYKNNSQGTNDQHNHNYINPSHNTTNPSGYNPSHMMNHHQANPQKYGGMASGGRPKNPDLEFGYRSKEGDVMLGFNPKSRVAMVPTSKVAHNSGDFKVDSMGKGGLMKPHQNMNPRDFR